ncbi:MAG: MFS transporter [Chloroflexi bacterium]|nr:MFS transporter [Chloroflexota bacterium]
MPTRYRMSWYYNGDNRATGNSALARRIPRSIHTFDAFLNPNYRLLWVSNFFAYISRWMQMTMLGWYVFEVTGSAFLVTLVGFSGMGPLVLLGVFGGVLADRLDKRKLLLCTLFANLLAATGMAALIFTDLIFATSNLQYWHAYLVMLVGGIGWGLDMPSRRTIVLDVLGRARVNNAIALDSVGMHSSRMLGPLIGGALISVSLALFIDGQGLEAGYAVTLIFFIISAVMMLNVKTPARDVTAAAQASWNILRNLIEGIRYVASEATLLAVVLITVFMNLLLFPYQQLIPVVAAEVLHVGPALMGLLLAFEGLGALTGSIGIASWSNLTHHGRVYLFGSLAGLTMLLVFSFSQWYGLSLALMLMLGLGTAGFGAMQATIILLVARDDMRGRGLGVITLAIGAGPIGALMLGWMADEIGAPRAMTINAVLGLITVGLVGLLAPSLRGRMTSDSEAERAESSAAQPATAGGGN